MNLSMVGKLPHGCRAKICRKLTSRKQRVERRQAAVRLKRGNRNRHVRALFKLRDAANLAPMSTRPPDLTTCVLLGTAVGDALGLGAEGLPRRAAQDHNFERGPFFGRAVLSDDTEQSFLVAQCLMRSGGEPVAFRRALRWRLVGWLFAGPPGVGLGTARSILKLAFGFRRGISTAGNGAAMRSAIIGAAFPHDIPKVEELVLQSAELTHCDARAFAGAFAVALAAGADARGESVHDVIRQVSMAARAGLDHERWTNAMEELETGLERGATVHEYASAIGCADGVTGYVYDTVPVALYAWARHDDPEEGLAATWACGGDTDTVGAIAGALLYARAGRLPPERWLSTVTDFPLTLDRVRAAGVALNQGGAPVRWAWFLMPLRNLSVFPLILAYALFVMMPKKYVNA